MTPESQLLSKVIEYKNQLSFTSLKPTGSVVLLNLPVETKYLYDSLPYKAM